MVTNFDNKTCIVMEFDEATEYCTSCCCVRIITDKQYKFSKWVVIFDDK